MSKSLKTGKELIYFDEFSGTLDLLLEPKGSLQAPILWPESEADRLYPNPDMVIAIKSGDRLIIYDEEQNEIFNEILVIRNKGSSYLRHNFTFVPVLTFDEETIWFESLEKKRFAEIKRCKSI